MGFLALNFLCLANKRHQQKNGGKEVAETGCNSQVFIMIILFNPKLSVVYHIYILLWDWGLAVAQLILPGLSMSPCFKLGLYLLNVSYSG